MLPVLGRRPAQPPRQHDRQRHLVELQAFPVRRPVDAGVLPPGPVGLLHPPQVVHEAVGRGVVPGGLLRGGDVVEVARPDQVVRARELGLLEFERAPHPRHRRRRDRPAAVQLVLGRLQDHQRLVVEPFAVPVSAHALRRILQRPEVARPARGVVGGLVPEPGGQRALRRPARRGRVGPEADRERHLPLAPAARQPRARRLHDVARRRCGEATVERLVGCEIAAGIARRAGVSARRVPQARLGDHGARRLVVPGEQRGVLDAAAVVVAIVAGRRIGQQVHLQRPAGQGLEAHLRQHGRAGGIGDPGLDEPPARGLRRLPEGQRPGLRPHLRPDVRVGLAVQEPLAVGHRELEVAEARRAQVRVVDLRQLGGAQREPRVALKPRGRPESVLVRRRPGVASARGAGRLGRLGGGGRQASDERASERESEQRPGGHRPSPYPRTAVGEHRSDGEGGIRTLGRG